MAHNEKRTTTAKNETIKTHTRKNKIKAPATTSAQVKESNTHNHTHIDDDHYITRVMLMINPGIVCACFKRRATKRYVVQGGDVSPSFVSSFISITNRSLDAIMLPVRLFRFQCSLFCVLRQAF